VVPVIVRSGIPIYVLRVLRSPDATRQRFVNVVERLTCLDLPPDATSTTRLDAFEEIISTAPRLVMPRLFGLVAAGMLSYLACARILGDRADADEIQVLTRGAPHNPTTKMDLALWALAAGIRDDPASRQAMLDRSPTELADAYIGGELPVALQAGLSAFLRQYGFRSVGEIDLGVARWSEEPAYLFGAIANYMRLDDGAIAPDAQFARGASEAEAMVETLLGRVHGPRRLLLRFFLGRVRRLIGAREVPKYLLIRRLFTPLRELLKPVGMELAASGRIASPGDIYFLSLTEARQAVAGQDFRGVIADRHRTFDRERARRHIPRVLLSDGTDAELALVPTGGGALRGTAASPGQVSGAARVVLSPHGVHLEPGEILVTPSTDPGWTPLFLTAGGLVMEMGGMMSHGAVVAREYGIPAVVGVARATELIATGQRVSVNGSAGVVSLDESGGVFDPS
jgi:pyruvate,water dikinase